MTSQQVVVERAETPVLFKRVADEIGAIRQGMQEVENAVGLHGRKYYGAFDNDGEYRVCVQLREDDDPQALGLEVGTLPGGRYARERLTGEPPEVYELIGPTFHRLSNRPDRDPSRPAGGNPKSVRSDQPNAGSRMRRPSNHAAQVEGAQTLLINPGGANTP